MNDQDCSFEGISVILCGDLHQFPPVAKPLRESLYRPTDMAKDPIDCQIGRAIYEEFDTVVVLKEQKRITDPVWLNLLRNLRKGRVEQNDITVLKNLIIGSSQETNDNYNEDPWKEAPLVTPRVAVRTLWNESSTRKWCHKTGRRLLICPAEDSIGERPLSLMERYYLALRSKTAKQHARKDLPKKAELAIGMKVMVTNNIETDLDITNGSRGEIVDIILHPDEPPLPDGPIVQLQKLPICILVKLTRTRTSRLEGLPDSVIPVEPLVSYMEIEIPTSDGSKKRRNIQRRQYPVVPAYAFTDYRSQGQTIPYVIVDIATPPTGGLSLFNVYVALSRS